MKSFKYMKLLTLITAISMSLNVFSKGLDNNTGIFTLNEIETVMLNQSLDIKSKEFEVTAAQEKSLSLPSNYIPKISLEGSYKYLSKIPEINMGPGRILNFGDNKNYSIGPTLTMTLLDFNSKSHLQTSLNKNVSAKKNEVLSLKSNVLFKTRYHYINITFLLEKRIVIANSLKVANKQLKDVASKQRFGSGSKLDLLTAQKEVHELESQFKEISFNIAAEQSELFKVSFYQKIKETNFETDKSYLESLDLIKNRFISYRYRDYNEVDSSKIKTLKYQSESLESQASSISSQRYPKVNLFARTSLDYPNGPDLSQFNQNSVGVTMSIPLFDGGEISHNVSEKQNQALALRHQVINEQRNLIESIQLLMKRIDNLTEQNEIIQKKIIESNEISELIYKSYQEGRATFIEVERANVKSREAKLNLSSNEYQITLNLIQLANIAGE
jgi:outer membrane protein